jgi:hypothetical protein
MSIQSTAANYGGRVQDNQQGIKQFYIAQQTVVWIYRRLKSGLVVETPADSKKPVLINNDLIVTGSIYNTSDERLKEEINEITKEEIDKLVTLNPIHFRYKSFKKKHYGFLAQDVEKVFPELVENNNDGFKTVNYQEFIPLILAKMQNMQNEIDELKQSHVLKNDK